MFSFLVDGCLFLKVLGEIILYFFFVIENFDVYVFVGIFFMELNDILV